MKNVEMNAGMQEMSMAEMESVNGGSWFSDAWTWLKESISFSVIPSGATW